MSPASTTAAYRSFEPHEEIGTPRILIVEDDDDVRRFMMLVLSQEGYSVDGVGTAWAGLRLLEMHEYAVVLSDYTLPGRDGVWMLTQAEAEGFLERTRGVLLVTAHPAPEGAEQMTVLHKPIDVDVLLRRIAALIHPADQANANSAPIDARAPLSSRRSRAKQNRM